MAQSARSVAGFWILAAMLLVSVASSAVPSPIYPVYAAEWHLTPLMLTGVFAIYVAGLLASLLVAGRLSDHVGRKPVLVVGGLGVALSLGLFAVADGVGALIVDRIVQGVSVGLLIGALGAALIDNSLERHPALAGVLNGVIPPIALATGALSSGALVEWGPAPEQLVYVLFGALLVLMVIALVVVPERVTPRPGALRSLRPRISVPRTSRRLFRSVAGSLVASWALGGMFLSLVPSALGAVFGIENHFAAGALIAVVSLVLVEFVSGLIGLLGTSLVVHPFSSYGAGNSLLGGFVRGVFASPFPFYAGAFLALAFLTPIARRSPLPTVLLRAVLAGAAGTVALALVGVFTGSFGAVRYGGVRLVIDVVTTPLQNGIPFTVLLLATSTAAWLWLGRPRGGRRAAGGPGTPGTVRPADAVPPATVQTAPVQQQPQQPQQPQVPPYGGQQPPTNPWGGPAPR